MFNLIEALNYRCLEHVRQPVKHFHTLIGPNASGKSTFLDVLRFLGDLVQPDGVEAAIRKRAPSWQDLLWKNTGNRFELAVEATIPENKRKKLIDPQWNSCRYQVQIGQENEGEPVGVLAETLFLEQRHETPTNGHQPSLFPNYNRRIPRSIYRQTGRKGTKTVVNKTLSGNDNYYDETGSGWNHGFKLGIQRSTLANLPEDETRFIVSTWLKRTLVDSIYFLRLDSTTMRRPSPPGKGSAFLPDGSNLPWVIRDLSQEHPEKLEQWIEHIRTSLPDLKAVDTHIRQEDRHCYLRVKYRSGARVPSWGLSDGTLRMFALTLLPYLPNLQGVMLIEEPENGIHPRAVETIYESLSSVYDAQVLVATHSPIFLNCTEPEDLLCFAQDEEGRTDIVSGSSHPRLRTWQRETDLATLFAADMLS